MGTTEVKYRPILFSTPMIQAILEGRKTQTRRIVKSRHESGLYQVCRKLDGTITSIESLDWDERNVEKDIFCPYGKPGDRLWVRETWDRNWEKMPVTGFYVPAEYEYKANYKENELHPYKWRPSIHMPRAACRIFLEITDVRVERLQDISEADIKAEGIRIPMNNGKICFELGKTNSALSFMPDVVDWGKTTSESVFRAFWAELWCKINGRESWDSNPFVWAITFKRIKHEQ